MKLRSAVALAIGLLLSGCVAPRGPAPVGAPPPPSRPRPVAPPAPPPAIGWRDAPLTTGSWRYEAGALRSSFADGVFALWCDPAARTVLLVRRDGGTMLTITTTGPARTLPAIAGSASLAARDPFLDQIAFSRGRFTVETPGQPRLILPAWPEVARVVEDCRG